MNIGIGSLSAALKQAGHQTSLIHITQPINQSDFIDRIKTEDPDLIGFSFTSNMFRIVKKLASLAEGGRNRGSNHLRWHPPYHSPGRVHSNRRDGYDLPRRR